MKFGEVWTVHGPGYTSKARPVVIVQSSACDEFDSIILCPITTFDSRDIPTWVFIPADEKNQLLSDSFVMIEKVMSIAKDDLGQHIGSVKSEFKEQISRSLSLLLGW
jgi:mRNA interferase MazF